MPAPKGNQHNKKPDSDRASVYLKVRYTKSDKAELIDRAEKAGLSLSDWVRNKLK